ncbi:MAG: polyprenyl synthetase family protein [Candidatus Odinarchaeota archaeon]|nr:polyprenyl synthetase family protein [Candidatus Odinarchaeota archaeon]
MPESEVLRELMMKGKDVEKYMIEVLRINASKDFIEVLEHQVLAGGKRLRPALTITVCEALGGKKEDAMYPAAAIELIHNFSLIVDDIIDHSILRRGKPTVWKKYGLEFAILASLHYREAIEKAILKSPNPLKIADLVSDTIMYMIEGERLDILFEQFGREGDYFSKYQFRSVSEDDYLRMIGGKTASLISASCKAGAIAADASDGAIEKFGVFGWNVGLAFQITDDYLDLFGDPKKLGKEPGKDIKEHKLGNIMIVYALQELDKQSADRILEILKKQSPTDDDINEAISLIRKTSAVDRAMKKAENLINRALEEISTFPENQYIKILRQLAIFAYKRTF